MEEVKKWNGRPIQKRVPAMSIDSDASLLGWGASIEGMATGGLWSVQEWRHHINVLELTAGSFAVKTFARNAKGLHVHLRMDNTTAVDYVNHLGGPGQQPWCRERELWDWCLDRQITLSAEYLPGNRNVTVDFQSRLLSTSAE